jgi:acyl-CoA thioesterase
LTQLDKLAASPVWRAMGLEVLEAENGHAAIAMVLREDMNNFQGVVHGGIISLLADSAMGRALRSALPDGERHVTFDLKMNFINGARPPERLVARAAVVYSGRRTALVECRVEGSDARLVATATGTFSVYLPVSDR